MAEKQARQIGPVRWLDSGADDLFRQPPASVKGSKYSTGSYRSVLDGAMRDETPSTQLGVIADAGQRARVALLHALGPDQRARHRGMDRTGQHGAGIWRAAGRAYRPGARRRAVAARGVRPRRRRPQERAVQRSGGAPRTARTMPTWHIWRCAARARACCKSSACTRRRCAGRSTAGSPMCSPTTRSSRATGARPGVDGSNGALRTLPVAPPCWRWNWRA
ncbi:hypothetical protein LP420_18085 [Massilia sp. B-10]|nr:hypothetical protein LP420_18085 [Massilia sp. B-10]